MWDTYQEEQLRRDLWNVPEIWVVGPIWFSAVSADFDLPANSIAVFDVEAHCITSHFPITTAGDDIAAHRDFSKRFLNNIQCALAEQGLSMAFKRKREISNHGSKQYKKLVQELSQKSNVTIVPPEVSAMQLVGQCAAVISMPFTSTVLYWREQNIPSTYYDPTGWIQCDDRAAHGIRVLIGIEELRDWIWNTFGGDRSCL